MSFCELVDGRLCGWSVIHALHTSLKGGVPCCCTSIHIQIQLLLPRFGGLQTQPAHSACTTTTRQEGAKKLDASKLKQDSKRQAFVNDLCTRLDALEHSSEETIHSSAMDSLGPVSRKHQDWFDENDKEIQGLLEEKHQKHKAYLRNTSSVSSKTAYSNICKTVQTRLRDMQDSWLSKKADEIQSFADSVTSPA